jgi:hypothetical protein
MLNHFDNVNLNEFTENDFTHEFYLDLHSLVGIDAVTEFGLLLKEKKPSLCFEYLVRLQEYYWRVRND